MFDLPTRIINYDKITLHLRVYEFISENKIILETNVWPYITH